MLNLKIDSLCALLFFASPLMADKFNLDVQSDDTTISSQSVTDSNPELRKTVIETRLFDRQGNAKETVTIYPVLLYGSGSLTAKTSDRDAEANIFEFSIATVIDENRVEVRRAFGVNISDRLRQNSDKKYAQQPEDASNKYLGKISLSNILTQYVNTSSHEFKVLIGKDYESTSYLEYGCDKTLKNKTFPFENDSSLTCKLINELELKTTLQSEHDQTPLLFKVISSAAINSIGEHHLTDTEIEQDDRIKYKLFNSDSEKADYHKYSSSLYNTVYHHSFSTVASLKMLETRNKITNKKTELKNAKNRLEACDTQNSNHTERGNKLKQEKGNLKIYLAQLKNQNKKLQYELDKSMGERLIERFIMGFRESAQKQLQQP